MTFTSMPCQALFLALSVVAVEFTAASHFRGAIIGWKPVDPVNFDGKIVFTHRISWRRSREDTFCNASTVSAGTLIGPPGTITCDRGCPGRDIGSTQFHCTDFNVAEDWSAGQGSNVMNLSGVASFEASFASGDWLTLVQVGGTANWEVRVKGDLTPRPDNGRINSSPTTAMPSVVRLQHGATHNITIPVYDADGDVIRCRWAYSSLNECADVCQHFPATLDSNNCTLTYNANGVEGFYVAAIQVEDFISASSTVAMSSVPVQFLVQVQNITIPPGVTDPTFVGGTPVDGSCIPVNGTYQQQIIARSGGDSAIVTDISTVSPPGLMRSPLTVLNSRESYINVTWTPSPSQQGANMFCYTATDNFGLDSERTCITFLVVKAPEVIQVTLRSFGNGTFLLSLQFDQQIKRPTISRYVGVFQTDGMQVLSVDVSNFSDSVYSGNALSISTTTPFVSNRTYYLEADSGVAVATAFCGLESSPVSRGNDEFGSITLQDGCPELPASTCGNASPVTWPETEIGQVASVPCPCGVSNDPLIQELRGTRRCGGTYDTGAMWEEPQCASCQFSDTRLTLCRLAEVDSPAQLAIDLVNATSNFKGIQSAADLSLVLGLLASVTDSPDLQQEEVQKDILLSVSNVQQVSTGVLTMRPEKTNPSARIFAIVDNVLSVIASKVAPGNPFEFAVPEFGVRVEDPSEELGENANIFTPNITYLLSQIINRTLENVPPAIVGINSTLLNDTTGSIPRISVAIYGSDALFQERSSFTAGSSREVGSIITDISLRSLNGRVKTIVRPTNSNIVRPTFAKRFPGGNGRNTTCQFWNLTADEYYGAWDGSNCRVLRETDEEVECGCDHLTHFAILLDSNPTVSHDLPDTLLSWVSYIGTVLSSISLTIIIITYLAEKNLRKELHSKLLINLCFALVGLYVTFIISTVSTKVPVLCGVVSALMHYFFLAVFFWMAAEAIYVHRKLVYEYKQDIANYFAITMAICWVIPVFMVIFTLAPQYQNYIHQQYCRVHNLSFWIGLVAPFGIVYIFNWIIFIHIIASLLCKPNAKKEANHNGNFPNLKRNIIIAVVLSLLFGLAWAVGLLASHDLPVEVRNPAEWIFTLMTAFLGLYLFIVYILASSKARGLWKRWLFCQRTKKHHFASVSASNSSRTRLRELPLSMRSWWNRLKERILPDSARNTNSSMLASNPTSMSANTYPSAAGVVNGMTSPHTDTSNELETITPMVPNSGNLQQVEIELVQKEEKDPLSRESNDKSELPVEVLMKLNETEFLTETIIPPNSAPVSSDSLSSIEDANLSSTNGKYNAADSKQTKWSDDK